jgi:rhamnosyltransferase
MDSKEHKVCIILATYNGEKFIAEQLDSLRAQTYTNWQLFIRDDGSTDETLSIIGRYVEKDNRICFLETNSSNLGSCQNFGFILSLVMGKYPYYMFCDQDDVWLPFKIEYTLYYIQHFELQEELDAPLMVYTNFKYVTSQLGEIDTKKGFQATKVRNLGFSHLLAQNPVYAL